MKVSYAIAKETLVPGIRAHYNYRSGKARFVRRGFHILLIALGLFLLFRFEKGHPLVGCVFIAYGVVSLFRRAIYVKRSLRDTFRGLKEREEITLTLNDEGLKIEGAESSGFMKWNGFVDQRREPNGLLLYPQKNIFYWIPSTAAVDGGDWEGFVSEIGSRVSCKL